MDGNAPASGDLGDRLHVGLSQNGPAAAVVGVLQAHQPRTRVVDVGKANGFLHVFGAQATAAIVGDRPQLKTAQGSRTGHLVMEDMGLIPQEHLMAPLAMSQQGHQIAHGAAGGKQSRLLAFRRPCPPAG